MRYHWLINTTNGKLSLHEKQTEIIKNGFEHLIEMILWMLVLMFNHSFYSLVQSYDNIIFDDLRECRSLGEPDSEMYRIVDVIAIFYKSFSLSQLAPHFRSIVLLRVNRSIESHLNYSFSKLGIFICNWDTFDFHPSFFSFSLIIYYYRAENQMNVRIGNNTN